MRDLQRGLVALGYWLGAPDGTFGDLTEQAVLALQKVAGVTRGTRLRPEDACRTRRGRADAHPQRVDGFGGDVPAERHHAGRGDIVGGVAVHGYTQVAAVPASHGCIRVSNAAMDHLWASGALPVGGSVWVA